MPQIFGKTQVLAAPAAADGAQTQVRVDSTGAVHARNELFSWVEGGEYFRACNPTPGTGIATGTATSFSATSCLLLLRNGSASKLVLPHYVRLTNTATGTGPTAAHIAIVLDTANRYSSGGTDLSAQVFNARSDQSPTTAVDIIRFGAVTATAAAAPRLVSRSALKVQAAPCWVVGDEVLIEFFLAGPAAPGNRSGTAAALFSVPCGPVVLGGQNHCLLVHLWQPGLSGAPSFEVEVAWWERNK